MSPIGRYHWTLLAACGTLFAAWEIVDHTWLMHIPMVANHGLDAGVTLLIVALTSGVLFHMVGRYQREIAKLDEELRATNSALSRLEATRDERLLELARDLSFSIAGLVGQAEVALQSASGLPNIKALSDAIGRAQKMQAIAHELLDLKGLSSDILASEQARRME